VKLVITHSVSSQCYLILIGGFKLTTSARSKYTRYNIFVCKHKVLVVVRFLTGFKCRSLSDYEDASKREIIS